jgi:hypothetical protein
MTIVANGTYPVFMHLPELTEKLHIVVILKMDLGFVGGTRL